MFVLPRKTTDWKTWLKENFVRVWSRSVEDLISTGGSSLKAVEAIRRDGCEVIGMVAAYTYGFPVAEEAFKNAKYLWWRWPITKQYLM